MSGWICSRCTYLQEIRKVILCFRDQTQQHDGLAKSMMMSSEIMLRYKPYC
jgi:hypothetical protein